MTDILTLVFRTFMSQTDVRKELTVVPPSPASCSALLVGHSRISRSVLLLAAVAAASEMGMRVVFFTQTQIQSLPVSLQKCVPSLSPESLKKIKFSYPRTVEELLQQVAGLHEPPNTSPTPPSLIIVDRLEGYLCGGAGGSLSGFQPGEQSCAAHLSALLCDTAAFLTQLLKQRSPSSAPCRVIASFQSEVDTGQVGREASATDPILAVLDRYFQVRCTLDRDSSYEAAAAGLQDVWHVYLSRTGITEASCTEDCEDGPAVAQEWQLLISPDGLMEFKLP
ncbi:ATPase SWSAP1 [Cottoperca gobio]|uniref:ATPase SWSAP1 n=1 Tax=Cottoperca gobio TaxID=56716 RepID=A0A6J2Q833_COTGO|nr:ATPase SWSAP1-like [Cottoperca gobio]